MRNEFMKVKRLCARLLLLLLVALSPTAKAQFVHPGCLSTQADLDRMKAKVDASASPWIESWNRLASNSYAQLTYTPNPQQTVCAGGVCNPETFMPLARDCAAAYQSALRYHISGNTAYADKSVQILNAWASTLQQITGDSNAKLRAGLYGYQLACAGELMRGYSGWAAADFNQFKNMLLNIFYPLNQDFLVNHNGTCISHYWANWDLANIASIMAIGVLCDDQAKFDEAVNYFKHGLGNGSVGNAVYYVHPGGLGQWQESGRDQGHSTLGMSLMGPICEIARNQGVDLYGYAGNRFLAGCEYVAKYNLSNAVPYVTYNNCDNVNQTVISPDGRGNIRPAWEMIYNHYVNRKGLSAQYTSEFAELVRPEGGGGHYGTTSGGFDQLGFGTLTHTIDSTGATPPAVPSVPTGLGATSLVCGQIDLSWSASSGATSYNVMRATVFGGLYTTVVALNVTNTSYADTTVVPSTTYYYVVSACNAGGESGQSSQAGTTASAGALPGGWSNSDIGSVGLAGAANYCNGTFTVQGAGSDIGGGSDSLHFAYRSMTDDATVVARLASETIGGTVNDKVGLMMRETTSSGARMVGVVLDNSSATARLVYRSSTGGGSTWINGPAGISVPQWFKLTRVGSTFTGYVSTDGVNWTTVASASVTMTGTITGGMAVCSRNTTALNVSTFDNVTAPGWPPAGPPSTPTGLNATAGNNQVSLTWNPASGATSYNVKRATSSGGPYTTITNVASAALVDTGLVNGTTYYYVVSAVNASGESGNSNEASATPNCTMPGIPTGLTPVAGNAQVALNWTASSGAASYNVKRATVSGGPYTTITNVTTTAVTDTDLVNGTTYYYVVSAVNSCGESGNSSQVSATPQAPSETVLEQSTSGGNKADVKKGQKGAQSFKHGSAGQADYTITKLVLHLSKENNPNGPLVVSIGTSKNGGTIAGSSVSIQPSEVTNSSAGSSFMTYTITYGTAVGPLTAGTTYYINLDAEQAGNGKAYFVELSNSNSYGNGTYFKGGSDEGKDMWFQIWGQ